jgi:hypothetical protein
LSIRVATSAGVCACVLSGCVQFGYERVLIEKKPDADRVMAFVVGETALGDVLAALGAPLDVFEGASGAPAITYGGLRSGEWGVSVSVPVSDYGSASVSYADTTARTQGFMLIFDRNERLAIVREGNLGDLRQEFVRRRPASIDGGAQDDADGGGSDGARPAPEDDAAGDAP